MSDNIGLPTTVFHMLEKNVGRKVLVILDPSYGFEGILLAVTHDPPGIWLSNADAPFDAPSHSICQVQKGY